MKNTVKLKSALRELKNRGDTGELATALASLLSAVDTPKTASQDSKTLARRFLAHAAALLKRSPLPTTALAGEAHDYIGAAIELNRGNRPAKVSSKVLKTLTTAEASPASFLPEPAQDLCDSCSFEDAEELQITAFANILYNGGYIEEARRYLCAYNALGSNGNDEGDEEDMKTAKQALIAQRANLRKKGDFARAKVLNEIIADMEDDAMPPAEEEQPQAAESKADVAMKSIDDIGDEAIKEEAMKAAYMMKAAEQMALDPKADQSKAAGLMKTAEDSMKTCMSAWEAAKAASAPADEGGKQTLEVEPASQEEEMAKQEASAAFQKGDVKKAKAKLAVASILEKKRLVAALLKKGDIELAMEGLKALAEEEKEVAPPAEDEDKTAGYPAAEDEAPEATEEPAPMDDQLDDDAQQTLDSEEAVEEEDKESEEESEDDDDDDQDEKEVAEGLYYETVKAVQQNKPKTAKRSVEKLEKLEAACRRGLRLAKKSKKSALIAEGKAVVAAVHKAAVLAQAAASGLEETVLTQKMLTAAKAAMRKGDVRTARGLVHEISIIANAIKKAATTASASGDKKIAVEGKALYQKVSVTALAGKRLVTAEDAEEFEDSSEGEEGLDEENPVLDGEAGADADEEALDDSLDQAPTDASEEENEGAAEGEDDDEQAEELPPTEDNAMHYEALSSVEQLQKMKVSRDALAFTFWDTNGAENPYWVVQASGKPVAEVHLGDQDSPEDIRAFFCDQVKWPNTIAQSVEKVGLYDMLKGVKARFYANAVDKSALASRMKQEAVANIGSLRTEKLATLKSDFLDATMIAAESLNKGLIAGKPNALKKAFVDRLMSLGISNPSLLVEDAFAEAFAPFMKQVMADAGDYLQMPKEAFEHTKKIIASATNVAHSNATVFAHETLSERLARTSMPLQHVPAAEEAPVTAAYREASLRERQTDLKARLKLSSR